MKGSEKQIAWANNIISDMKKGFEKLRKDAEYQGEGVRGLYLEGVDYMESRINNFIEMHNDASVIIDNKGLGDYGYLKQCVFEYIDRAKKANK